MRQSVCICLRKLNILYSVQIFKAYSVLTHIQRHHISPTDWLNMEQIKLCLRKLSYVISDRTGRGSGGEQQREMSSIHPSLCPAAKLLCIVLHRLYFSLSPGPAIKIAWYTSHMDYLCNGLSVIHSLLCDTMRTYCLSLDYSLLFQCIIQTQKAKQNRKNPVKWAACL